MIGGNLLVVRNYAPASVLPLDREDLLKQGYDLVEAIGDRTKWRSIRLPSPDDAKQGDEQHISSSNTVLNLGGSLSDPRKNEKDSLKKLRPFQGTDFSYLLKSSSKRKTDIPVNSIDNETQYQIRKRKSSGEGASESETLKRRRLNVITLQDLIPLPHYFSYPSSLEQGAGQGIMKRFLPFSKAPLVALMPYTADSLRKYLEDQYARAGWIVPVHGKLPWTEATPAVMRCRIEKIEEESICKTSTSAHPETAVESHPAHQHSLPIMWTPELFKRFWSDLIEIRKRGTLGALSFSFCSPPISIVEKDKSDIAEKNGKTSWTLKGTESGTGDKPGEQPKSLKDCSYVKIYCDIQLALYVRSVLDAWRAEVDTLDDISEEGKTDKKKQKGVDTLGNVHKNKKKIRPLLRSKLVLVDEVGCAIGIC